MIDPKLFEKDPNAIERMLEERGEDSRFLTYITTGLGSRQRSIKRRDDLRAKKKDYAAAYVELKKDGFLEDAEVIRERGAELKADIKEAEYDVERANEAFERLVTGIPNFLHPDVPAGKGSNDNRQIRVSDEAANLGSRGKAEHNNAHVEIAGNLLQLERAAKMAGNFPLLRGKLARLERAIGQFFLDHHTSVGGYEEVSVPLIVNEEAMFGTGQLPKFKEELYHTREGSDKQGAQYLIPTAEVPLTNIYRDEVISESELPIKMVALTPCFRTEVGKHGKEVRGLIRQHQFNKVELVQIVKSENAEEAHLKLLEDAETLLTMLGLPYRVMLLCAGDTSFAAHKCYDIEVWLPSQGTYREVSSISQFSDFQARRAKIRYKPAGGGKTKLVHTINGSGLAVGRTLVAILENYLQEDGTVLVPEVLRPYTKFDKIEFNNGIKI